MSKRDINKRIQEEIDATDDEALSAFLKEILSFERSKMDRDQPHFRNTYRSLIERYGVEEDEFVDDTEADQ